MKLKFFPSLILVVLLGGCSLLSQGDEEASFLADANRCDVASLLNKEQSNVARSDKKSMPKPRERRKSRQCRKTAFNSFRADSAQAQQRAQQQYIAT